MPQQPIIKFEGEQDYRVKLKVPYSYLESVYTRGGDDLILQGNGGIIFPYTPAISYDTQAQYAQVPVMHSNFPFYSYKSSTITPISLTAKFTVQNDKDAIVYLSMIHLLRALTKMRWGIDRDPEAGAPPPVCRLDAYGDFMLKNVPVAIQSFKFDLPDTVDYYATTEELLLLNDANITVKAFDIFGTNFVPTVSTLAMTLVPMYSRAEQLAYSVDDWLNGNLTGNNTGRGYL